MDQPVYIDRERMDKALASPTYRIPHGFSREQIIEAILAVANATEHAKEERNDEDATHSATLIPPHKPADAE